MIEKMLLLRTQWMFSYSWHKHNSCLQTLLLRGGTARTIKTKHLGIRTMQPLCSQNSLKLTKTDNIDLDKPILVEPTTIFLQKFENAVETTRNLYECMSQEHRHILVASVKSSGSLFMMTAARGRVICSSKNGSGNVYSVAGHYILLRHFRNTFGENWRIKYHDMINFVDDQHLSLGFELVTRCLGEHASHPRTDHMVLNAVVCRKSLSPCSPLLLLDFKLRYGLEDASAFYHCFDQIRWDLTARWAGVDSLMRSKAWRTVPMNYEKLHSPVVEGFVTYWIPRTEALERWAAAYNESGDELQGSGLFAASSAKHQATSKHIRPADWPSVSELYVQVDAFSPFSSSKSALSDNGSASTTSTGGGDHAADVGGDSARYDQLKNVMLDRIARLGVLDGTHGNEEDARGGDSGVTGADSGAALADGSGGNTEQDLRRQLMALQLQPQRQGDGNESSEYTLRRLLEALDDSAGVDRPTIPAANYIQAVSALSAERVSGAGINAGVPVGGEAGGRKLDQSSMGEVGQGTAGSHGAASDVGDRKRSTRMFCAMRRALEKLKVPFQLKVYEASIDCDVAAGIAPERQSKGNGREVQKLEEFLPLSGRAATELSGKAAPGGAERHALFICVQVMEDSAFRTYEAYRAEHPEEELPPLLRGNMWEVCKAVDDSDQEASVTKHNGFDVSSYSSCKEQGIDVSILNDLRLSGPVPGTTWKFKMLCYTHRTFLLRNCGTALARTLDLQAYMKETMRILGVWGAPREVIAGLFPLLEQWSHYILGLGTTERQALQKGQYLDLVEKMLEASTSAAAAPALEGGSNPKGLYVVFSIYEEGRKIAKAMAERIRPGLGVMDGKDVQEQHLRFMAETVGVVYAGVLDGAAGKILNLLRKVPLKYLPAVLCTVEVTEIAARASGERSGINGADAAVKKNLGMTVRLLKQIKGLPAEDAINLPVVETTLTAGSEKLEEKAGEGVSITEWLAGPGLAAACDGMVKAMRDRVDAISRMPPPCDVHVVLFITMVGWGKNAICDAIQARTDLTAQLVSAATGEVGQETEPLSAAGACRFLESDTQANLWSSVSECMADERLRVLVLNRNCPPNSWAPTLAKLRQAGQMHRRKVRLVAVVPRCDGSTTHAFSLRHFAVCLAAVQGRCNHPGGLDGQSMQTARTASKFYECYRLQEGHRNLVQAAGSELDVQVAVVPWLREHEGGRGGSGTQGENDAPLPAGLADAMNKVLSLADTQPDEAEKVAREALSDPAHAEHVRGARLPLEAVVDGFVEEVAAALSRSRSLAAEVVEKGGNAGHDVEAARARAHVYISLVLHKDEMLRWIEDLCSLVPEVIATRIRKGFARKDDLHVTLWHPVSHPQGGSAPPFSLASQEGLQYSVQPELLVADASCVAVAVRLLNNGEVKSFNRWPHITLSTEDGVKSRYSNDLLERLASPPAQMVKDDSVRSQYPDDLLERLAAPSAVEQTTATELRVPLEGSIASRPLLGTVTLQPLS